MEDLPVPNENVYVVLITCDHGVQTRFKATGDIAGKIIRKVKRPKYLRGVFKMKTVDNSALLVDLARVITVDITKFADMTDDVSPFNT